MTTIVANGPGIGDAMVLSAVAARWPVAERGPLRLVSQHPELLTGWPGVESISGPCGGELGSFPDLHHPERLAEHQIIAMLRSLKLETPLPTEVRCWYRFDDGVIAGDDPRDCQLATIHPQPGPWTRTRDWPAEKWDAVSRWLGERLETIQLGAASDRRLPGVAHYALGEPLRHVATYLSRARLHVGCISGMMHIASAVGTPAVIVAGGREDPAVTCYLTHRVLTDRPDCSPCWRVDPCPFGSAQGPQPCMDVITVDEVIGEIEEALGG